MTFSPKIMDSGTWIAEHKEALTREYQNTEPNEAMVTCNDCHGKGYETCDLDHDHDCEECDGSGKAVADSFDQFARDLYNQQVIWDRIKLKRFLAWHM